MKNKIVLLLVLAFVFAYQTKAQIKQNTVVEPPKVTPAVKPEITRIYVHEDSITSRTGFSFTAYVYSVGKGTVTFQWILSPQPTPRVPTPTPVYINGSFVLSGSGVDKVPFSTVIKVPMMLNFITMKTTTPNVIMSNALPY